MKNSYKIIGLAALSGLLLTTACDVTEEELPQDDEFAADEPLLESSTVDFGHGPTEIIYEVLDGQAVLQDDMVLGPVDLIRSGEFKLATPGEVVEGPVLAAALTSLNEWPGGRIPYKIDATFYPGSPMFTKIIGAITEWNTESLIKLAPAVPGEYHVRFRSGTGCSSNVGYLNSGANQSIWLASNCSEGNIVHEIGHTAGFHHEQARNDRNDHVTIAWSNILPGKQSNFETYNNPSDFGSYDLNSVMQYSSHSFSRNGGPTIVKDGCNPYAFFVPPSCLISSRSTLSDKDIVAATRLFLGNSSNWVKLKNDNTDECLRPVNGSRAKGARVETDSCLNTHSRYWDIRDNPHGAGKLIINRYSNMCLHYTGVNQLVQATCDGSKYQQFDVLAGAGALGDRLRHRDSGRCIRHTNNLFMSTCTTTSSRRWRQE